MKRFTNRLSPATAIACIALFVSLGGVSYGVATGSIDTREIKNNTIRSKDISNSQVFTQDIRNSTVRGTDVRNNTLTGADILESSLGKVPSATTADNAGSANTANTANTANNANTVNGASLNRIAVDVAPGSSSTVVDKNGFKLVANCSAGGTGDLDATTSVDNADLYYWGYDTDNSDGSTAGITGDDFEDEDFNTGENVDIDGDVGDGDFDTAIGQIEYYHPSGVSGGVTVHYVINEASANHCHVSGFVIG